METETFKTGGVKATVALGRQLAGRFVRGDCVALIGDLGAGKTALVRGIAAGLGLADQRLVASPTYVLVHEYPADVTVFHLDLYRLTAAGEELAALGLDEMLSEGVALIEWADRAGEALPSPRWEITIELIGQRSRRFSVRRIDTRAR